MHEFYQFCYVGHSDQRVHGISSPFQFVDDPSAIDWELVENEPQPAPSVLRQLSQLSQLSQSEPSIVVIENDSLVSGSPSELAIFKMHLCPISCHSFTGRLSVRFYTILCHSVNNEDELNCGHTFYFITFITFLM
jgi:hypothetical protein